MTDEQLTDTVVAGPDGSTPEDRAKARRNAIIRTLLVGGYLFVVFGILLPRIVSYSDVIDAFRAAPPEALLIVALIGILSWISEGMAINAILPMLGIWRATVTWLSMTAVGSTIPGPVKMAFGYRLYRNWGLSAETAALGLSESNCQPKRPSRKACSRSASPAGHSTCVTCGMPAPFVQ